ncbi:MAG: hypothetical protein QHH15_04005 [Candidatus Thermoplasmatota archaeon]|nr:hypothetical protein [Candidatus Thermoplasmatota archaeon]
MNMFKEPGIPVDSMALDKYYSSRTVIKIFGEENVLYLIPKKNIG